MISRRPGARFNRGRIAEVGSSLSVPALISPRTGDTFYNGSTVYLAATAGATATGVEFYTGNTKIGDATKNGNVWYYIWTGVAAAAHTLKARATYPSGTQDSATVSATMNAATGFSMPATVKAYWQTSDNTNVVSAGGLVSAVHDKMGIQGDAAQAGAGLQPLIAWCRGQQGLFFGNQSQQRLVATLAATINQTWWKFVFFRPCKESASTGTVMVGGTGGLLSYGGNGAYPEKFKVNANTDLPDTSFFTAYTEPHLITARADANGELHRDGTLRVGPQTTGSRTITTPESIGASSTGTTAVTGFIGDPIIGQGMSGTDVTNVENELKARYDVGASGAPAKTIFCFGDSLTDGTNDSGVTGGGWPNRISRGYSGRGKAAGRWADRIGPLPSSNPVDPDDQHYGNSGKGISFMRTNLPGLLGAGHTYNPNIIMGWIGAGNLREIAPETYVAGTGPGTTAQAYIDMWVTDVFGALPNATGIVTTLVDSNPAFGTGPNDYWTRLRTWNALLVSTIWPAIEAATGKTLIKLDCFTALGLWDTTVYAGDQFHPGPIGQATLADYIWWNGFVPALAVAV